MARYLVTLYAPRWEANRQLTVLTSHGSEVAADAVIISASSRGWAPLEEIEVIDVEEVEDGGL